METLYEPIARTLLEWTGKDHAALLPSHLLRAVLALIAVSLAAAFTREWLTERAGELLGTLGLIILIYDILGGSAFILSLGAALNVLLVGLFGILAFKARLITNAHLKLLLGLALLLPLYPLLIVFPLTPSLFDIPFNLFGIPLLINLTILVVGYTLYHGAVTNPPWKAPPLAGAFAERVPVEDIHTHDGFICYTLDEDDASPTITGLSGTEAAEYLDWRNTTDDIPDADTLADLDDPHLDQYFDHQDIDVSDAILDDRTDYFHDLSNHDSVWMSNGPAPEVFIFVALVLALGIGNLPLYLVT